MIVSKVTTDLCTAKFIRLFIIILLPIIILSAVNLRHNRTNHKIFLITTSITATKSIIQYIYIENHTNCRNYFERSSKRNIYEKINNNNNALNNNIINKTESNISNSILKKNKTDINNINNSPYLYIHDNNYLTSNLNKHNNTLYSNYIFKITIYISAATCIEAIPIILKLLKNVLCWRLLQIYYCCIYYNYKIVICKRWINNIMMMHGVMIKSSSSSQQPRIPCKLQQKTHKLQQQQVSGLSAGENPQPQRHYTYQQYLCHHHQLNIFELIKRKVLLTFANTLPATIIKNNLMVWIPSITLNQAEAAVATETLTVTICYDIVKINLFLKTFLTITPVSVFDSFFSHSKHDENHQIYHFVEGHHHAIGSSSKRYNIYHRLTHKHKQIQLQPQQEFNNNNKRHCSKHCGNMYQQISQSAKIKNNNIIRSQQSYYEERLLLLIRHNQFVTLYYIFHNNEIVNDSNSNKNKKNKKNLIKYMRMSRTMTKNATATKRNCSHSSLDFTSIKASRLLQPVTAIITIATIIKCNNIVVYRRCIHLICNCEENKQQKCLLKINGKVSFLLKIKQQRQKQAQQRPTDEKEDCKKSSTATKSDKHFCNCTCYFCYLICFCSNNNNHEICCSLWGQRWWWWCCCCRYCYCCYCCYHCCVFYHYSCCHCYFMTICCTCCHQHHDLNNKSNNSSSSSSKDKGNKTNTEEIKTKSLNLDRKYQQEKRQRHRCQQHQQQQQKRNDKKRSNMHISCKESYYIHQEQQWQQRFYFFINYINSSCVMINCCTFFEWFTDWRQYNYMSFFFQTAILYLRSITSIATESRATCSHNNQTNRNIFRIINSNLYHFSMRFYNKLLDSTHLYRIYLIKMLSAIPIKRRRRRREHYHHHSLHPLVINFKKSKYNHIKTCNIANDQQLKTNNLCKIFCNNRKRHRRRRRRRRRHINKQEQQQQQLLPHQQYLISQQPTIIYNYYISDSGSNSNYYNINSQKLSKQIRIVKNLLVFNAFKTIIKTISLSRSTLSNQKSSTKIKTTKTTTRTKTSIKTKISSIATTTTTCICTTTVTRSSSLSTSVSSSFSVLTTSIYKQRTKPNFVWLFIGLVWFEGPKLVNCSFISNSQQQQEKHQQQKHHHQQLQTTMTNLATTDAAVLLTINNDNNTTASPAVVNSNNNFTSSSAATDEHNNNNISSRNHRKCENITMTSNKIQKRTEKMSSKSNNNNFSRKTKRGQGKTKSSPTATITASSTINLKWFDVGYTKEQEFSAQSDRVRLESIKQQILSKLGLTRKPNVSHPLPTQFIWDTIYRADGISSASNLDLIANRSQQLLRIFTAPNALHKYVRENKPNDNGSSKKKSVRMNLNIGILDATATENHYASYTENLINYTNILHYPSRSQEQHNKYKNYLQTIRNNSSSSGSKHSGDNKLTYLTNNSNEFESKNNNDNDEMNNLHGMHQHVSEKDTLESEDFFGSTQEIITFAEKGNMYKQHISVEFSPQTNEVSNQKLYIHNAEIHIRIDRSVFNNIGDKILTSNDRARNYHGKANLKIWIFRLIGRNYTQKGFDQAARFCASFSIDTLRLGWQKFDLTNAVKQWYTHSHTDKLRLLIDCTGCGQHYVLQLFNKPNDNRRPNQHPKHKQAQNEAQLQHQKNPQQWQKHEDETQLNPNRPFLVIHTETKRVRRVRRRAIDCMGAIHSQCCKESFYVSFKALGWDDWIIAPRGYFANYCRGDCTGPFRTPDTFQTFHAHFIEEYRKMGLLNGMQPCCAPIKFSSMSLIYYGDDGIIKRDLPKMVVDECGCP